MSIIKKTIAKVIILLLLLQASSCVVYFRDTNYLTKEDQNGKINVVGAHYVKRITPVGIGAIVATATLGAYAGYNSNMFSYYKGDQIATYNIGGAYMGAIVGTSTGYLSNLAMGWGKKKYTNDKEKWLKPYNKNYMFLEANNKHDFRVINKNADSNYKINNEEDINDFKYAFKNSTYTDDVIKRSLKNLKRDDLYLIIKKFPNSKHIYEAKKKYILHSNSYYELTIASDRYPEINLGLEDKFLNYISDVYNAFDFAERFPNSKQKKKAVLAAFNNEPEYKSLISKLKSKYPNDFYLTSDDLKNASNTQKQNYLNSLYDINTFTTQFDILDFYEKYNYIDYYDKSKEIMNNVWEVNYDKFDNGNYLIGQIYSIPNDYPELQIENSEINSFINVKLKNEMHKVKKKYLSLVDNQSSSWEAWKEAKLYDAPFVEQRGQIQYLCYGRIKNNSKFDLPVKLAMELPLIKKTTTKFLGMDLSKTKKNIGTGNTKFYIPVIKSGEEFPFAALFDFGSGVISSGVKILAFRNYSEIETGSLSLTINYYNNNISESTYHKQREWLDFAKNGFSNDIEITDFLGTLSGNTKYDAQAYKDTWKNYKRDLRNTASGSYSNSSSSSSQCYEYVGSKKIKILDDTYFGYYIHCIKWDSYETIYFSDQWRVKTIFSSKNVDYTDENDPWQVVAKKVCSCIDY